MDLSRALADLERTQNSNAITVVHCSSAADQRDNNSCCTQSLRLPARRT